MSDPTPTPAKPGYKTTEFWLSTAATLCGILLASGVIPDGGTAARIVGAIVSGLAALGYSISRGMAKS
jgi:hypothetical protein